jgi:hypothetical protein
MHCSFGGNTPVPGKEMIGTNYEMFYRLSQRQQQPESQGKINYDQFAAALRGTMKAWSKNNREHSAGTI